VADCHSLSLPKPAASSAGFEIVYKAKRRTWVLHANLVVIGGKETARAKFEQAFQADGFERAHVKAAFEQQGSARAPAKPLNPRDHAALLKWMWKFEFEDFLLLINARRQRGNKIVLSSPGAAKN
jgi:hypothetical protein